jgi:simple sugar transport system ATP-binding protein
MTTDEHGATDQTGGRHNSESGQGGGQTGGQGGTGTATAIPPTPTTDTAGTGASPRAGKPAERGQTIIEVVEIGKSYGSVIALRDVTTSVRAGEVTCVLGDNGAGKSTFIKILAGAHQHTSGKFIVDGVSRQFNSPRAALALGIATVYQDLAVVPLMPVWRNFFLGSEMTTGWGPLRRLDIERMKTTTKSELAAMGIDLRDVDQPIGTLSGGERQCVAIARAVYFGARVLILDEPTAALGVKEAGVVLRYIAQARARGLGVVFITHNVHHAYPIGDRFTLLNRGTSYGTFAKSEVTREEVVSMMAGGEELDELAHELEEFARTDHARTVRIVPDQP